jgi:sec-independent protein translocase protein TatA
VSAIAIFAEIIGPDLLIVLAIVALLFGSSQLPKLARSLGSAKSEFEKGIREGKHATTGTAEENASGAERVTLTRAELETLLAEREAQARGDVPPPPGTS